VKFEDAETASRLECPDFNYAEAKQRRSARLRGGLMAISALWRKSLIWRSRKRKPRFYEKYALSSNAHSDSKPEWVGITH